MKSLLSLLLLLATFVKASPTFEGKLSVHGTDLIMQGYIPRSCLDYLRRGIRRTGLYVLFDHNGQVYRAFCDFSSEPPLSAWTLVMSWVTTKYQNKTNFKSRAFYDDAPVNEEIPNWEIYRQTLARMTNIRKHSTHWRATCNFQLRAGIIIYKDYLRGKFSDFDIMLQGAMGWCHRVEYINILGNAGGSGTTVRFWQYSGSYLLHIESYYDGCEFTPPPYPRLRAVDYFGYYGDGLNPEFTCSRDASSTTQWWFGGYLGEH